MKKKGILILGILLVGVFLMSYSLAAVDYSYNLGTFNRWDISSIDLDFNIVDPSYGGGVVAVDDYAYLKLKSLFPNLTVRSETDLRNLYSYPCQSVSSNIFPSCPVLKYSNGPSSFSFPTATLGGNYLLEVWIYNEYSTSAMNLETRLGGVSHRFNACTATMNTAYCNPSYGLSANHNTYAGSISYSFCIITPWTNTTTFRCNSSISAGREVRQVRSGCGQGGERWVPAPCPSGQVCTGAGVCQISNVINMTYWADLSSGLNLSNAEEGDTVLMVVGGQQLTGTNINFTVQRKDASNIWNLWNLFGLRSWNNLPKISGRGVEPYVLNSTGTYKFIANIATTSVYQNSSLLEVSGDGNANPLANITLPLKYNSFERFANTSTNFPTQFNQRSYDDDDLLNISWNFGDETFSSILNYSKFVNASKADLSKTYTQGGRYYDVVLTAKEMTRDQSAQDSVRIYVFQPGINVVPIISSPVYGSVQTKHQVLFNASQSYVANCSTNMNPSNFSVGNLNCSYILAPGQKDPLSGTVKVRWSVQKVGNSSWELITPTEGIIWNSTNYNAMGGVEFNRLFSELSQRKARLEVMYDE